jgi:hypothetical protein
MYTKISELVGKTIDSILGADNGSDSIIFTCSDGTRYHMYHSQDCCESVSVDDIIGDVADLIDSPVLKAEEATNSESPKESYDESFTWTFYHIATIKGYVTIKWYGTSNGYYSESVDFERLPPIAQ